ncbi:syntenin-1-like isoform X2 [Thrips palmi]|uniref:Syntenin-1-like isoform X2 n=1 Tax=Thrips palmi TaxID=161013 RepID=A0A6P9A5A5_THRPL|nr:syntenin-1-like isoform X2 [Thrips palmi]
MDGCSLYPLAAISAIFQNSADNTSKSVPDPEDKGDIKPKGSESEEKSDKMLYPSLEDLKVDQLSKAQGPFDAAEAFMHQQQRSAGNTSNLISYPSTGAAGIYSSMAPQPAAVPVHGVSAPPPYSLTPTAPSTADSCSVRQYHTPLYPTLNDYMGLDLSPETIALNMPEYSTVAVVPPMQLQPATTTSGMVAPLSGHSLGLQRAQVTHGIRELTVCKDAHGKVGLRVQTVNSGVFVCVVVKGSPAAMAGLRFGDQILQVNGHIVAGYTMDQVHKLFKESPINGISVIVRDRPFERTVTLHKDSTGHVGFHFKEGKIVGLVQDSSAARNGLLTDHHVLEVNGQNVVGVPDKDITAIINEGGQTITITIIPTYVFDHMVKKMSSNLLKSAMDHSIPNV